MSELVSIFVDMFHDVARFASMGSGRRLRRYQLQVARAIVDSVVHNRGLTFVVVFPRQSGKNELQAQIETYLLALYSQQGAEMVKASPTWKPQTENAMRRLERSLSRNIVTRDFWTKESGYIYRIGEARMIFLSGSPSTSVVGATASTLLECDEAQDVLAAKWDKDFAPMAASTDATRVFWGTMWTSQTLLARELRAAQEAEKHDGRRRVWVLGAGEVAKEVPAYGRFVAGQAAKLGRNHPLVRSQFYSETIDGQDGLFPERRLALMRGKHPRRPSPELSVAEPPSPKGRGRIYALLLDVAGEDEAVTELGIETEGLANPKRDSTALTVVEVDLSTLSDQVLKAPTYRVVDRVAWVGVKHSSLYGQVRSLAQGWGARYLVIDATGVGAGLASFLARAFPGQGGQGTTVIPFTFNAATKSRLGWEFLAVVETGRFLDWEETSPLPPLFAWATDLQALFFKQCRACEAEILPGPERRMRWGVPDGKRDPETGELLHDDLLLSAALVAVLDRQPWSLSGDPLVIRRDDPLQEMDGEGF